MDIKKIKYLGGKCTVEARVGEANVVFADDNSRVSSEFRKHWYGLEHQLVEQFGDKIAAIKVNTYSISEKKGVAVSFTGKILPFDTNNATITIININADELKDFDKLLVEAGSFVNGIKEQLDMFGELGIDEQEEEDDLEDPQEEDDLEETDPDQGSLFDDDENFDPGDVDDDMTLAAEDTGELGVDDTEQRAMTIRSRRMQSVNEG